MGDDKSGSGSAEFVALIDKAQDAVGAGRRADAARLLEKAQALEPDNPSLWVNLARLRYRGGAHSDALEAADRALELDPAYAPALVLRGQLVRDAYGLGGSLVWFEAAIEADPANPQAWADYAATLGDAGQYGEMLAATRRLSELDPGNGQALYFQAVLAARAQNPVLAKSLLERSGKLQEGIPAALLLDALTDLQEANHDSASRTLERLAQMQPGNPRVVELLARAMWLGGRDQELVDRFAPAAHSEAASPYLAMLVARAYERLEERDKAAPFLEKAYGGRPLGWVALDADVRSDLPEQTLRMRQLIGQGQTNAARGYGDRLVKQFPGSADIAVLAGDAALAARNPAAALGHYREAVRIRRAWPLTRKAAAAYSDLGDTLAADVLVARHLSGEPHNTEALLVQAERSARLEDWLRVAVLLDNAIALGAGNDPRLLKLRAIAARALGEKAQAERFEQSLWELNPRLFAFS